MSYSPSSIRDAIRDVLIGAIASVREVDAAVFLGGVFDGQPAQATNAKTLHSADHRFDVRLGRLESHAASPVGAIGSYRLARLEIGIDVKTKTSTPVQLTSRDTVIAQVHEDLEIAAQALCYPGNAGLTALLAATGIVSGLLSGPGGEGFPVSEIVEQDWDKQLISSRISASAVIKIDMPTS